jgi:hypothetical protein
MSPDFSSHAGEPFVFLPFLGRPSAEHRSALAFDADLQRVAVGDTGLDDRPNPSQTSADQKSN